MLRCAVPVLLLALAIGVLAEETVPPQLAERIAVPAADAGDLAGSWLLTMPAGFEYEAVLEATDKPGHFRLRSGATNLNGVYELRSGRLSMSAPADEKMVGLAWDVLNRNVVVLTEHPESSRFGSDYRRATLSRHKAEDDERLGQYKLGAKVILKADREDHVKTPVTVELPGETPYLKGSREEALYLQGFAEGYADFVRTRTSARSNVGDRTTEAWREGWKYGYRLAGDAKRGESTEE